MSLAAQALTEAERLAKARISERCRWDLFFLCKHILGYDDLTEDTHGDLCRYAQSLIHPEHGPEEKIPTLTDGQDAHQMADKFSSGNNFLLLLMPRGSFKSSVVTIGFSLQVILNDPNARILIDSETFSKSKAFLAEVKGHLDANEKYREVFHSIHSCYPDDNRKDDLYSDSQLNVAARTKRRKEPTFSCAGIDVTKTGMHYDLIIADDLMSEKNITSPEQIEQVVHHYKLALSLLDPGKPLIVIGTRWDYNDVYQHIWDHERDRFNVLVRKATLDDGTLFFPERLTSEFLDATKKSQGSYLYSCQYQNEPVDNETAAFKRSQFQRRSSSEIEGMSINWYCMVDPSFMGEHSDYAALVVAGMSSNRELYVRYIIRQKLTYAGIIDKMFEIYFQFPEIRQFAIETIATQKSIQYELSNQQKRRGAWLPVTEIKQRTKSKEDRIMALTPYYEFGHVFHLKECPQIEELEYELLYFPRAKHDDVIDAFATLLEIAAPPTGNKSRYIGRNIDVLTKPRSPLTKV